MWSMNRETVLESLSSIKIKLWEMQRIKPEDKYENAFAYFKINVRYAKRKMNS